MNTTLDDNCPMDEGSLAGDGRGGTIVTDANQHPWGIGISKMDTSWVKIHRKLMDHWLYATPAYTNIWLAILCLANFKQSKVNLRGKLVIIERGEMLTSTESLAKKSHTSRQQVRTFLKHAQQDGMILVKSNQHSTILKVLNYEDLQSTDAPKQPTANQHLTNTQPTANHIIRREEGKKGRKEEEKTLDSAHVRSPRPTLDDATAYFAELSMPPSEAQRFVDYYTANGWKVGKNSMKDWKAAARNWKRNYKPQGATNAQVKRTVGDRAVEIDYPEYLANLYAMDLRGGPGGSVAQLGQGDGGAPELGAQSEHPTGQNEISVHGAATGRLSGGASRESPDVDQVW